MSDVQTRIDNLVDSILAQQQAYVEESKEYAERGHRNHYCFHGVNMWVDYDCACGACENGEINEYSTLDEVTEYAEEIIAAEEAKKNQDLSRKRQMIQWLIESDKNYSFYQAEQIVNNLLG